MKPEVIIMKRNISTILPVFSLLVCTTTYAEIHVTPGPSEIPCFDVYEIALEMTSPPNGNPFTDIEFTAEFVPSNGKPVRVEGFCDDPKGKVFRIRFCPEIPNMRYSFSVMTNIEPDWKYRGRFQTIPVNGMEPVVVDPDHPKHFCFKNSQKPFYHLGITAYHLLDPTNGDRQIEKYLDYCVENKFNKIRFLLTGYPRDTDTRSSDDYEYGVGDPWKMPNYGAPPGEVNPLPAWEGKPHDYDFTRFNVEYWQKVDRAVAAMRERGIVATCILTIEKQNLPKEYGALTEHEKRLYRYAVNRLAAFANIWWDLGNEHNEFRDPTWASKMGQLVKKWDPYNRLCSAHGYAEWNYDNQEWADFIITQQYGTPEEVNAWALKYRDVPMPYINEEYGYEGNLDKPGHGHNADWVRKCHWAIAMAGGYGTYGDWSKAAFYSGHIGGGSGPAHLKKLYDEFQKIPYNEMEPRNDLVTEGCFCLAKPGEVYMVYVPDGREANLEITYDRLLVGYEKQYMDPCSGDYGGGWVDIMPGADGAQKAAETKQKTFSLNPTGASPDWRKERVIIVRILTH